MSNFYYISLITLSAILFYCCSASTDTRYSKEKESKEITKSKTESNLEDDFNITPYKTRIEISDKPKETKKEPTDLWFGYSDSLNESQTSKGIIDTIPGYRVQVISTDDLDEANSIRSEIYFKTDEKALYIIFEPPFYVVRVGDCKTINDAKALNFKLNQLGFSGTKIVNDSIIVQR